MKKTINSIVGNMLCAASFSVAVAQTPEPTPTPTPTQETPAVVTPAPQVAVTTPSPTPFPGDKTIQDVDLGRRLNADLRYRNAQISSKQTIDWYDANTGYYGIYAIGNNNYMSRYDKDGNFVGTYQQSDWNGTEVPAEVKTAFEKSPYKANKVTAYYSSTDPNQAGYYIETENSKGKASRVWASEKGKISTIAPVSTRGVMTAGTSTPKE